MALGSQKESFDNVVRELEAEIMQLTSRRDVAQSPGTTALRSHVQELENEYAEERKALIEQIEKYEEDLSLADALVKSKADELDDALFSLDLEKKKSRTSPTEMEIKRVHDKEFNALNIENERLRIEQLHLTDDFNECCQKMDDLSRELSEAQRQLEDAEQRKVRSVSLEVDRLKAENVRLRTECHHLPEVQQQLQGALERKQTAETRLAKSQEEKSEVLSHLNAANTKIKELFAEVQGMKNELNMVKRSKNEELRRSLAKIHELVDTLSSENADLKEENDRLRRARDFTDELQCLLSSATRERDTAYVQRDNLIQTNEDLSSKFKELSTERDTAIREKESIRTKLDKIAAQFEADYESLRAKIDALLMEKNTLENKITFLQASKASVECNADRILERDTTLSGQLDRLKLDFKVKTMRVAELQDEVDQLGKRVSRLKGENNVLSRDNSALKEIIRRRDDPNSKRRAIFGFGHK